MVKNPSVMQEMWVRSLGWDDSGGGHGNPLQYTYLENPHGQRSLEATVHVVAKSRIGLSNFHFGHFGLLIG